MTTPDPTAPPAAPVPEPIGVADEAGTPIYAPSADGLHVTVCAICGQIDDHPKHGFVLNAATGEETRRHMDCCAPLGCPICAKQIAGSNGATGQDLRDHIVAISTTPEG